MIVLHYNGIFARVMIRTLFISFVFQNYCNFKSQLRRVAILPYARYANSQDSLTRLPQITLKPTIYAICSIHDLEKISLDNEV